MVSLPYSKNKRYLTGIDWFVHSLNTCCDLPGRGGLKGLVALEMDGTVNVDRLRACLVAFLMKNPVFFGQCRRDWNLAPYWKVPDAVGEEDAGACVCELPLSTDSEDTIRVLANEANRDLPACGRVAFSILPASDTTILAVRFDHDILDARGTEMLLQYINTMPDGGRPIPVLPEPAHLDRWTEKFKSGQQANRHLFQLCEQGPPVALPAPTTQAPPRSCFSVRTLRGEQVNAIEEQANLKIGYLMMLPFLIGSSCCAFERLCRRRGIEGGNYLVSVNLDARSARETSTEDILFNRLSFNNYGFTTEELETPEKAWSMAMQQLYDQVKSGIAKHISNAMMLMRIAPAPLLIRFFESAMQGGAGSFSFSSVTRTGYTADRFMGARVRNIYHLPSVLRAPRVGIFFTRFRDRLNVVVSYREGTLSDEEAQTFRDETVTLLLGGEQSS